MILIENAISGVLILAAITISSYTLGLTAFLSSLIGTLVGKLCGANIESVNQGLFGYNSVLTGMALSLFLTGYERWIISLVGAAVAVVLTAALMHFMQQFSLPVLTFPFVVLTWVLLLSTYRLLMLKISPDLAPQTLSSWTLSIKGELNWLNAAVNGIGQIFFLSNTLSGVLLFIALFWAGWRLGLYAIAGNVAALITAYALGGEHTVISMGLYGYNAILTILALSSVFKESSWNALFTGMIASCLTVPLTASIDSWLMPIGLPALTMPFVLSTWIFIAARKVMPNI